MADRPEDDLPTFKILVVAKEYRIYTVPGNGQDDARVFFETHWRNLDYDIDGTDEVTVEEIWED